MKKKFLLLGASLLSFGLIGGTLAFWAVTDKADPLNVGISPGTVTDTDSTKYVTLEWGSSLSFSNVSNLERNQIRKAAVLDLKALSDEQENYTGSLEYSLSYGNTSGQSLIENYLEVKVYPGDVDATAGVVAPATVSALTPLTFTAGKSLVTVTNTKTSDASPKHNLYTVCVNLKTSMTLAQYDEVSDAQVTLTVDWNANSATILTARTLYAKGFTGDTYVYAFGDDDVRNAKWPGVKMSETNFDGYYEANVDTTKYHTVIFNNGDTQQSADLAITTVFPTSGEHPANCFQYTGEGALKGTTSQFDATKEPEYYIVGQGLTVGGKPITWAAEGVLAKAKMTVNSGKTTATLENVTAVEGARFKVYENVSGQYLIEGEDWLVTSEWAGVLNITYTIGGHDGSSINVAKVS